MASLDARRIELLGQLESALPPMPRLHPNLAELYRQKVMNLAQALNDEHTRLEAAECIRELIEEIRLVPDNGKLRVELYGELAALINLANEHPRSKGTGVQITLVAGARNHLDLHLRLLTSAALTRHFLSCFRWNSRVPWRLHDKPFATTAGWGPNLIHASSVPTSLLWRCRNNYVLSQFSHSDSLASPCE